MSSSTLNPTDRTRAIHHWLVVFEQAAARRRQADLDCARALAALEDLDGFHVAGCASAGELGERRALSAQETRDLLDLGRALEPVPRLEPLVRDGRITVGAAGCLGRVLTNPHLQREGDDWFAWAQAETTQQLRRRLWKRLDEVRTGRGPVVPMTVFLKPQGVEDFRRARMLASRKAGEALTFGQTLERAVDTYLSIYDTQRRRSGARRIPDTTLVAGRYVPMAVRREVYERQGGRCAVPLCDNDLFLDYAHLVPHAVGGSREADNLLLLCTAHHLWFDLGEILLRGTAAKPRFLDRAGNELSVRFAQGQDDPPGFGSRDVTPPGLAAPDPLGVSGAASPRSEPAQRHMACQGGSTSGPAPP